MDVALRTCAGLFNMQRQRGHVVEQLLCGVFVDFSLEFTSSEREREREREQIGAETR